MDNHGQPSDRTTVVSGLEAEKLSFPSLPFEEWDRYKVLGSLGEGGTATVYKAFDPVLNRHVALKFLWGEDHSEQKRFLQEARSQAQIEHDHICKIYEIGTFSGKHYIAMQFIDGESLEKAATKMSVEEKCRIIQQVSEAVHAAHRLGIIHRDLKPGNIMVEQTETGLRPYVLDFGLARQIALPGTTITGMVIGTPSYMSPEQAWGNPESLDRRTDVYSLGATMYRLFSGRPPYDGKTMEVIFDLANKDPIPLRKIVSQIPMDLETIVMKCLAREPYRRYDSAHAISEELGCYLSGDPILARPPNLLYRIGRKAKKHKVFVTAATASLVLILLFLGLWIQTRWQSERLGEEVQSLQERILGQPARIQSLAVLPLKNLSGDPKQEYFADGMTEELTATLARIESLRVISRTSVMEYKNARKPLRVIAKELNVDAIVEGSVLQVGARVRITAQLVEVTTDRHLWAQSYERDLGEILSLQNEVARSIAQEIQIKLTPQDEERLAKAPSVRPEAYEAYLRGMYYTSIPDFSEEHAQMLVELFERAVELDPNFLLAYVRLSLAHSRMVHYGFGPSKEHLKKAKAAVDRSFELQPDSPEAHLALGYYYYHGHKNYEAALKEFAICARDPSLPSDINGAVAFMAFVQRRQGNFKESIENLKRVLQLNPRDSRLVNQLGHNYTTTRNYSEAERYYDRAISLAPDAPQPYRDKAWNYWLWMGKTDLSRSVLENMPNAGKTIASRGDWFWQDIFERNYQAALNRLALAPVIALKDVRVFIPTTQLAGLTYRLMNEQKNARTSFEAARELLEKERKAQPDNPRIHSSLGIVYAGLGRKSDAIREGKLATDLIPISKDAFDGPDYIINLALIYVMVQDFDAALEQIEYLLSIPSGISVPLLKLDPHWDPLRSHPRYQTILQKYQQ